MTISEYTTTVSGGREPLLKRPLDVILTVFLLIPAVLIAMLVALAIKLGDRGPVFYTQERWGRGGKTFKVYKFRTMVANSDHVFGLLQARENDPRITRVGRILRAMALDELPQVLNILRGEMSFVGPRALAVGEIVHDRQGNRITYEHLPGFHERLAVRPGLTSLATVSIPRDTNPRRKFRYDLLYIRYQSIWLDLRLIALSVWISIRGKCESRGKKI